MEIEELMKQMICLFDNVGKAVLEEQEKLSQKDMELSDLDHYLEINKLKSYELAKLGKLRQRLRKERRDIKDKMEMLITIKRFTDKYNNKLITGDIIQNLKEQKSLKEKQENPKYKYRTNILDEILGEENAR